MIETGQEEQQSEIDNCSCSKIKQAMHQCSLRKLICGIFVLGSYGLFTYFSIDAIVEFAEGNIGVSQISTPVTELALPTITVCSKEIFKNVDSETSPDDILKNLSNYVFTWNDFFHHKFLENLQDWDSHEIFNPRLGVCFSLKFKHTWNSGTEIRELNLLKAKK